MRCGKEARRAHLCTSLPIRGEAFSLAPLSVMSAAGFRKCPSSSRSGSPLVLVSRVAALPNGVSFLSDAFSAFREMFTQFSFSVLSTWCAMRNEFQMSNSAFLGAVSLGHGVAFSRAAAFGFLARGRGVLRLCSQTAFSFLVTFRLLLASG